MNCDVGEATERIWEWAVTYWKGFRMNCDVDEATEVLENALWRRWSDGSSRGHSPTLPVASTTSHLILQTLPLLHLRQFIPQPSQSLHLRHSSFSQAFRLLHLRHSSFSNPPSCFTYVTTHYPSLPVASPTSQLSLKTLTVASTTSQLILQTLPSLHLHHSSFSNPSGCSTYVTVHSQTHTRLHLRHKRFTYVTWRAAHGSTDIRKGLNLLNW